MDRRYEAELLKISPYDDTFPARLLSNAFDLRIEESNQMTNKIYNDVVKQTIDPNIANCAGEEKIRLIVDASDDFMENVLQEYSRLIEGTIAENAYMLSQCDTDDSGKSDGI